MEIEKTVGGKRKAAEEVDGNEGARRVKSKTGWGGS